MAKLKSGKELKPDFTKITIEEYRTLIGNEDVKKEDELIGKVYGLTGEELRKLSYYDYRMIIKEFLATARDPAGTDPN